ncbi:DUF3558 domain-containing protein [Amycolatopsis sp. cg5]|uniref:DUF3558 domain-containing protein n=1 Tax=Amycolatopsis sp. cg5 TaxID=3238802 RepID=UPI0035259777
MHIFKNLALAVVGLLVLTGCTQQAPGTASGVLTPSSTAAGSPTPSGDEVKAPPVKKTPLDVAKFVADPCVSLTEQQLQGMGSTAPGSRNDLSPAVACHFKLGGEATAGVGFLPTITSGLTQEYQKNATGWYKTGYFEPTEIEGYPAVQANIADQRADGNCGVLVGVSDQSYFSVYLQGPAGKDACKAATNVAKAVLETIKGSQ